MKRYFFLLIVFVLAFTACDTVSTASKNDEIESLKNEIQSLKREIEELKESSDDNASSINREDSVSSDSSIDLNTNDDMKKAKEAADQYCNMLRNKQPSITSIIYTGNQSNTGNMFYFDYTVTHSGLTRTGTVKIKRGTDGSFEALGLDY